MVVLVAFVDGEEVMVVDFVPRKEMVISYAAVHVVEAILPVDRVLVEKVVIVFLGAVHAVDVHDDAESPSQSQSWY